MLPASYQWFMERLGSNVISKISRFPSSKTKLDQRVLPVGVISSTAQSERKTPGYPLLYWDSTRNRKIQPLYNCGQVHLLLSLGSCKSTTLFFWKHFYGNHLLLLQLKISLNFHLTGCYMPN